MGAHNCNTFRVQTRKSCTDHKSAPSLGTRGGLVGRALLVSLLHCQQNSVTLHASCLAFCLFPYFFISLPSAQSSICSNYARTAASFRGALMQIPLLGCVCVCVGGRALMHFSCACAQKTMRASKVAVCCPSDNHNEAESRRDVLSVFRHSALRRSEHLSLS